MYVFFMSNLYIYIAYVVYMTIYTSIICICLFWKFPDISKTPLIFLQNFRFAKFQNEIEIQCCKLGSLSPTFYAWTTCKEKVQKRLIFFANIRRTPCFSSRILHFFTEGLTPNSNHPISPPTPTLSYRLAWPSPAPLSLLSASWITPSLHLSYPWPHNICVVDHSTILAIEKWG